MLSEDTIIGTITVLAGGQIEVRSDNRVLRDGVVIATNYHRHVVSPGDSLASENPRVRDIAEVVHTPSVIRAYNRIPEVI